jgi:sulfur relay (sulfurtransferase) complex TusBCD TusD component (DsrE family)
MSEHYLLIASRDPYTHTSTRRCYELAGQLSRANARVTVFLLQNGVLPARPRGASEALEALARSGVRVVADELSLRERGIALEGLAPGIEATSLEPVIEALESGAKVLWH